MRDAGPPTKPPEFFSVQVRQARRFYLDLAPPASIPLAVVCGGFEACAPDYAIRRSSFPYCSIEVVARGRGALVLSGREYALGPGAVFSYGPGVAQHITTSGDDLLEKYFVDFTGSKAAELLEQHGLAPGSFARVGSVVEVQAVLESMIGDGLRGTVHAGALCATLVEYLIVKLADSIMPWEARQTPAFATYERCRRHMAEHFVRLRSLEEVARECRVDAAYLCRLFRRFDHQTPYRQLKRLKMSHAAQRLQRPGVLVRDVAAELGFEDPFHFSRAFKQVFGLSPERFRRLR